MSKDPYVSGWTFHKLREWSILIPFIIFTLALIRVIVQPGWFSWIVFFVSFILLSVILYFFRDPDRIVPRPEEKFFSPGDGVVSDIEGKTYADQEYLRIGIFLSVFDVHVQRAPIAGEVAFVEHRPGRNHPAFDPAASSENDQIVMGIQSDYGLIIVKQIAGILARRCVNFARKDDQIQVGQRYGLIKFGSRVELYVPSEAKILCTVGDKVFGGISALAEMRNE